MTTKEFKGKDNLKLDIVVSADELTAINTWMQQLQAVKTGAVYRVSASQTLLTRGII
ncbi:hypothetical protein [Nostoc sp.]|uniref:hypothetical protein n=1 Tax=Nostoc sp. TaxID=1180 RepID=UPI002FEFFE29